MSRRRARAVSPYLLVADSGTVHFFRVLPTTGRGRFVTACGNVVTGEGVERESYRPLAVDRPCGRCGTAIPAVTA
jgi:hypothetical protein